MLQFDKYGYDLKDETSREALKQHIRTLVKNQDEQSYILHSIDTQDEMALNGLTITCAGGTLSDTLPLTFSAFDYENNPVYVTSEHASIVIGNDQFFIRVPNYMGDGETEVRVLKSYEPIDARFTYHMSVQGPTMAVYADDCDSNSMLTTIYGDIDIYIHDGKIQLKES